MQFQQTGGSLPITWTVTAGTLPAGLTLNSSTGQITGTPTATGHVRRHGDGDGRERLHGLAADLDRRHVSGDHADAGRSGADPGHLRPAVLAVTFNASGGATPHTFAVTAGALPPGLTLASGGSLTGSPTNTNFNYAFTVTATDSSSASCTGAGLLHHGGPSERAG